MGVIAAARWAARDCLQASVTISVLGVWPRASRTACPVRRPRDGRRGRRGLTLVEVPRGKN